MWCVGLGWSWREGQEKAPRLTLPSWAPGPAPPPHHLFPPLPLHRPLSALPDSCCLLWAFPLACPSVWNAPFSSFQTFFRSLAEVVSSERPSLTTPAEAALPFPFLIFLSPWSPLCSFLTRVPHWRSAAGNHRPCCLGHRCCLQRRSRCPSYRINEGPALMAPGFVSFLLASQAGSWSPQTQSQ